MKDPILPAFFLAWLTVAAPAAEVTLASPFGHHMVLQQGMAVPVWGTAKAGETVTVEFAGQKKSATADATGKWRLALDAMPASAESRALVLGTKGSSIVRPITDVLVGEVWLCGGQSNMERRLGLQSGQKPIVNWEQEVADADLPLIRQFYVPHRAADTPQATTDGAWSVCSPATAPDFSAVGLFFARDLHRARGVPVGILHSSYGGTPAEAWTSREGLAAFPEFADLIATLGKGATDPAATRENYRVALAEWFRTNDPGSGAPPWSAPDFDASAWSTMTLPATWENAGHPGIDGVAWFQKTIDLPEGWAGRDLTLALAAVDDVDTTWVNGVEVGSTSVWDVQRLYRVSASALRPRGNVITVRVLDTGGDGGIWNEKLRFELAPAEGSGPPQSLAGPWRFKFSVSLDRAPRVPEDLTRTRTSVPTVLYNAMIAPLAPYAIRGVAFYQGEANASRAAQYRTLLPATIADWRRAWAQPDLPFLFVQIAPHNGQPPEIREAQLLAWQATKNTAMIVTTDVGDATDIHPANKRPVGERLALAAQAIAYREPIEYSGPVYEKMHVDGRRVVLHFTHLGGGLVANGGPLHGFTLVGVDGAAQPALAEIVGDTVVVSSPDVAQPVAARYAWAHVATGNLCNRAGLPASPFRTDIP